MPEPTKIPRPFADSGDKNSIPDSSGSIGFASWQEGFPSITSEPFAQGGVAPKRADFNGIFNALSLATLWQQQGGVYAYDNTTDYEVGNVVEYNNDLYKCITANGPSSAVKAPTDATVWDKVMTAADVSALYLPLAGGTMTGSIKTSASLALGRTNNSSQLTLVGGSDTNATSGAKCVLNGDGYTNSGWFNLQAGNSGGYKQLIGKPDGTLTWDSKEIPTVETGTFTPTMYGGTIAGSLTYTSQSGTYVLIGELCFVELAVQGTVATVPTGNVNIGGLPFMASTANQSLLLNIAPNTPSFFDRSPVFFRLGNTTATAGLWGVDTSNNVTQPCRFASSLAVGTSISTRASGIYRVKTS